MILVDTGPLVALCDKRDAHHGRAVRDLQAHTATSPFGTCDAVIVEACFHLQHRAQRRRLHALLEELDVAPLPPSADRAFRAEVFDWLDKYADHDPDWADGCLVVLCDRLSAPVVWTYDPEFGTTWRLPDGSRVPLAVS